MSGFHTERPKMSAAVEAQSLMQQIGGMDHTKAARLRASSRLHTWTMNRIRDVYYADPRIRISAEELDQLRAAARARKSEEYARDPELLVLHAQLSAMAETIQTLGSRLAHVEAQARGEESERDGDSAGD